MSLHTHAQVECTKRSLPKTKRKRIKVKKKTQI